jgi:hypothetical protein
MQWPQIVAPMHRNREHQHQAASGIERDGRGKADQVDQAAGLAER